MDSPAFEPMKEGTQVLDQALAAGRFLMSEIISFANKKPMAKLP